MMGGGQKKQAEASQNQQIADLQAQQDAMAQQQAAAQAAPVAAAAPPAAAGSGLDDQLIQIQKLSAMKDQGVITEEEFAAKKALILGI